MEKKYKDKPGNRLMFKNLGMSQLYDHNTGRFMAVSILQYLGTNLYTVTNKHGISEKFGFTPNTNDKLIKSDIGQLIKNNINHEGVKKGRFQKFIDEDMPINDKGIISLEYFKENDIIDVQGISKGKGFTGVMKRYNFKGGRASHGASLSHRCMGSTGSQDIGHVDKGKKMPGRHGGQTTTVHNLIIKEINLENNTMVVKGSVPGPKKGIIYAQHAIKYVLNQTAHKPKVSKIFHRSK